MVKLDYRIGHLVQFKYENNIICGTILRSNRVKKICRVWSNSGYYRVPWSKLSYIEGEKPPDMICNEPIVKRKRGRPRKYLIEEK